MLEVMGILIRLLKYLCQEVIRGMLVLVCMCV